MKGFYTVKQEDNLKKQSSRITWIDVGKALTIVLIYYFHICEGPAYKGFQFGEIEYRLLSPIISFFFFMSGMVFSIRLNNFKDYCLKLVKTILVPLFFFNILSLIILMSTRIFYQGPLVKELPGSLVTKIFALFFAGLPSFNGPTWYLTCIFTIQIICFFLVRYTNSNKNLIISMIFFSVISYLIVPLFDYPGFIVKTVKYFWFTPMALSAIVFFQAGILFRRASLTKIFDNKKIVWLTLFLAATISITTTNLNHTAHSGWLLGQHLHHLNYGNYFLFYISYFSMLTFLMCVSMLVKPYRILVLYGQNVLVVFGFAGIYYHFINPGLTKLIIDYCQDINQFLFFLLTISLTIIQLALCYPFFNFINKCLKNSANVLTYMLGESKINKKIDQVASETFISKSKY